jgi:hypothetical protein
MNKTKKSDVVSFAEIKNHETIAIGESKKYARQDSIKYYLIYLRRFFICAVPLLVAIYSIWYWSLNHQQLIDFYKGLNPGFYKAKVWERVFFTGEIKSQGNWWCLTALVAAMGWAFIVWKSKWPVIPKPAFKKNTALVYAGIVLAGVVLSILANRHTKYGTDEVFSALNFAALPSFQCFSYYALPNNHILFNFINGITCFRPSGLVQSGRVISLICYAVVLCSSWFFLQKWIRSNWLRSLSLLVLALQFPAWGFSGQARGYELLLLLSLLSLITFWAYWFENKKYLLPFHVFCNVAGMLTIPSYLYWWFGLAIASLLLMLWEKRHDWRYIRASFAGVFMTVLVFLPLLSFSGLAALDSNVYVRPGNSSIWNLIKDLSEGIYFKGLFDEWFCLGSPGFLIGFACVLCPLLMFFYPPNNKRFRALGILYFSMMIAFFFMTALMLRVPFNRNMIAHGYVTLMFILIILIPLLNSRRIRIAFGFVLSVFIVYSAYINFKRMPVNLYYFDNNSYYYKLSGSKTVFKPGSTVYLDDECFYWQYIVNTCYPKQEIMVMLNRPSFNRQDYCIMPVGFMPPSDTTSYRIVERIDEYNIFERIKLKK